jgi:hypothetical protein
VSFVQFLLGPDGVALMQAHGLGIVAPKIKIRAIAS